MARTNAKKLLLRGDFLSIESGRLVVTPGSGKPLPEGWLEGHSEPLCGEILKAIGQDTFRYETYTTGRYGPHKSAGVTLQFIGTLTGEPAYVIFNADLNRARGVKKRTPLPKGQFSVGRRSHFYKFWLSTGLKLPDRRSRFHDYMGNLKGLIFIGILQNKRIRAESIRPLWLNYEQVKAAILPHNSHTTSTQLPHNIHTSKPHKDSSQSHAQPDLSANSTTGDSNHGNKVISNTGTRVTSSIPNTPIPLEEQTVDEWLSDYGE